MVFYAFDVSFVVFAIAVVAFIVPVSLYREAERATRGAWPRVRAANEAAGLPAGAYRHTDVPATVPGRAPGSVRAAALASFAIAPVLIAFGLCIPCAVAYLWLGLFEPYVLVATAWLAAWLVAADRLSRAGRMLLERAPESYVRGRLAATRAGGFNALSVLGFAVGQRYIADPLLHRIAIVACVAAVASLAHAALVGRALRAFVRAASNVATT
jgi:hypothetical protein